MTDKLREALEREQFERWRNDYFGPLHTNVESHAMWTAWQARAALAAPVVEDAQTEVPPEVQLTPEEAAILKRALWKSVKVLAPAPTQPPTQLDTDSDDAKGLAAPPGYWHGHNAAQDVLASVMETELATYRAEVVALIGRGAALEAEVERLRIALATVTTRPPAVEAEPVRRLVDAAMAVISRHDEWVRQMPAGAFDDPLSVSLAALHDAAETVGISLDIVRRGKQ